LKTPPKCENASIFTTAGPIESSQALLESPGRVVVEPRKVKDPAESGVSYLTNSMGAGGGGGQDSNRMAGRMEKTQYD